MSRNRIVIGWLVAGCVVLSGCAAAVRGQASTAAGVAAPSGSVSTPESSSCTDVTYADPSIAFEPSLADGALLETGETTWISGSFAAADIQVSGDESAVDLADRSGPTTIACGEVVSSIDWVELSAERPGKVVLTLPDGDQIRVTVR